MPEPAADLRDEVIDYPLFSSELVYAGRVWDVRHDRVDYPGGAIERDFVDHPGAVGVLPFNNQGEVLLINQYRHPIRRRDWEVVAGLLDEPGEHPLDTARRELAEEADLQASTWHTLLDILPSPGGLSEAIRIFLARDISDAPHVHFRDDEESHLYARWVSLDEAVQAVLEGRIQNGPMCAALLAAEAAKNRQWATLRDPRAPWDGHPLWRERG